MVLIKPEDKDGEKAAEADQRLRKSRDMWNMYVLGCLQLEI